MFRRILVPIDGSHASNRGLDQAIKLAADQGAALCILHVIDEFVVTQDLNVAVYAPPSYIDEYLDALRDAGKAMLAKAEAKAGKLGIKSQAVLTKTMGNRVADIIIDRARKWRADLIVIGTHGRRGLTRLVMGSDAEHVVRYSPVPVLLVRAPDIKRARARRKTA